MLDFKATPTYSVLFSACDVIYVGDQAATHEESESDVLERHRHLT
jgi:hypothetical protein